MICFRCGKELVSTGDFEGVCVECRFKMITKLLELYKEKSSRNEKEKVTNEHAKKCFRAAMIEQDEEQCNEYIYVVETYFTQQEKEGKLAELLMLHYEKVEKLNDLLVDLSIVAHRIFTGKSVDIISDRLKYETLRDEVTKELKEENE